MKIIIVLGCIVPIILVTIPVFESTRISAQLREWEFKKLQVLRRVTIFNLFGKYTSKQLLTWLDNFIMNEAEFSELEQHLKVTGHPPEEIKKRPLKNPKLYLSLRYDPYVELIPFSKHEVMQRLMKLKTEVFIDSPLISIKKLYDDYVLLKMNELISLEDYYALQAMLRNYHLLHMDNQVSWRIKRALYSLAIRQYSPDLISNFSKITCFTQLLSDSDFLNNLSRGRHFTLRKFIYCIDRNAFKERLQHSVNFKNVSLTSHSEYVKVVITDPRAIVNLKEMLNGEDREEYVILPSTIMSINKRLFEYKTPFGLVKVLTVKTVPVEKNSEWLTKLANNIEMYKNMEEDYVPWSREFET